MEEWADGKTQMEHDIDVLRQRMRARRRRNALSRNLSNVSLTLLGMAATAAAFFGVPF